MSILQPATASLDGFALRVPLLATMRVHRSTTVPTAQSTAQNLDMWIVDLDQPIKLSRWATGLRTPELGVFSAAAMVRQKARVLEACQITGDARVLMLANADVASRTPRVYWVTDPQGAVIAQAVDVQPHLTSGGMVAAHGEPNSVTCTLSSPAGAVTASGALRTHLDAKSVRIGLRLTDDATGEPVLTISMAGSLSEGNPRVLLHAATALAA